MDARRPEELKNQGWVQVGDDLVSPELIKLIQDRVDSDTGEGEMLWEDMVAEVEKTMQKGEQ